MGDQATGQDQVTAPQVAGFWRRFGALFFDSIFLCIAGYAIGFGFYGFFASIGSLGRLIGFIIAMAYFAPFESRLGKGQSPGKWLLSIRVVGRDGNTISLTRSVLRYCIFGLPYFLNGVYFSVDIEATTIVVRILGGLLAVVVFGGGFALLYLILFNRKTRQSLHDVLTETFVIDVARSGQPVTVVLARLHLFVVGAGEALIIVAVSIAFFVIGQPRAGSSFAQLAAVSKAAASVPGIRNVRVQSGFFATRMASGNNANIHFLQVSALVNAIPEDEDRATANIAAVVLKEAPDLLGNDTLVVLLTRGFDLGFASWSTGLRAAYPKNEWEKRVRDLSWRLLPLVLTAVS